MYLFTLVHTGVMSNHTAPAARPTYVAESGETVEIVDTTVLVTGDLVLSHDMRIRLGERHTGGYHADAVWFDGVVENAEALRALGRDHVTYGLLRADGTWTVQGNELATWRRVISA